MYNVQRKEKKGKERKGTNRLSLYFSPHSELPKLSSSTLDEVALGQHVLAF